MRERIMGHLLGRSPVGCSLESIPVGRRRLMGRGQAGLPGHSKHRTSEGRVSAYSPGLGERPPRHK